MTRISDRLLVQNVGDGSLVLVDESAGEEVVVPLDRVPALVEALSYFAGLEGAPAPAAPPTVARSFCRAPYYDRQTGHVYCSLLLGHGGPVHRGNVQGIGGSSSAMSWPVA